MVCATLRKAPNKAYFEFENHPALSVVYTFSLEIHKNISTPKGRKDPGFECGNRHHINRAKNSLNTGATKNGVILAMVGFACSFTRSFKASANGWGIPIIPTLLGPFRIWKYPRALRSSKVKKAMANKAVT